MIVEKVPGGVKVTGHGGGKGGGSTSAPTEAPDSLHSTAYAKVLDLVSEGEIYGPASGTANILKDIFLDGTPIQNDNGSLNFQGVTVNFRSGTQNQSYIPGFPSSEVSNQVGVEFRDDLPWVQAVSNLELSAVRITLAVAGLSRADQSTGDIYGYSVSYAIDLAVDGGAYQTVLTTAFSGKTTSRYQRTHRISLPDASTGWTIRVRRITPNSDSALIADETFVDIFTEVIDAKLRYPMSALVGVEVNAEQFQSIPTRAYKMRGRIIKVPTNYDPVTRTYSGTWNGTFKLAYSNNPAWIFYDMVINDVYGVGHLIPEGWINRWALYQIGQYCDESVPDGKGGTEPRFTCNAYFQAAGEAWRVLQDLAHIFRGMAYYAAGSIVPVADMPKDPVYTYTNANVIDGKFNYVGSGLKTRYTVALVSWNDPADMGRAKVEAVEDREGIARYGIRKTEVTAIGCSSQGQAQRVGRWLLFTSKMETRSVTFGVGLDGSICQPGQIIRVADQHLAGRRIGGRVKEATSTSITTDAPIEVAPGDTITITLPSGVTETRTVSQSNGTPLTADTIEWTVDSGILTADLEGLPDTEQTITVTQSFSETPVVESVWTLEKYDLKAQTYRVLSVAEGDGIQFEISAVQHIPDKFAAIDYQTKIETPPITVVPPSVQPPPTNVQISSYYVISQGVANHVGVIQWTKAENAVAYEVQWRRDDGDWVSMPKTGATRVEIPNLYAGDYLARVRAINALNVPSVYETSTLTTLSGITAPPPVVTSLNATGIVFGINLSWAFPTGPNTIERTEIWYHTANNLGSAIKLGDFAYPQNNHSLLGLAAGTQLYFWARLVDKNGTVGDFYPELNGVSGQSSSDASEILDYLAGKIAKDQLAQELLDPIESIEGIDTDIADLQSAIQTEQTARVNGDQALAQDITTLQSAVDGNTSSIQTQAQTIADLDGELSATYTIRAEVSQDGKLYAAGMGLGVYTEQGTPQSSVYFLADRFAILNLANGQLSTPFVIQGGQTFINQAFIGDAWITNAKIENAAITTAKIADANITNAKIANAAITYAKIGDAQVDTLKIAGEAVSIARSTTVAQSWGGGGYFLGTWYTIGSFVMPAGTAANNMAFQFYSNAGVSGLTFTFRVLRNGGVWSPEISNVGNFSGIDIDTSAGRTYAVQVRFNGYGTAFAISASADCFGIGQKR